MKRRETFLVLALVSLLLQSHVFALDIALSGESGGGKAGGGKIGVVDMKKIYQISPRTLNAKEDYNKRLKEKEEFLKAKEKDLDAVKTQISVLETTIKAGGESAPANPMISTDTAPGTQPPVNNASLFDLKQQLETKQAEYADARKQAIDDLAAFEANQNQVIFGDIYKALKDVAEEEQVSVIVDKSSILFGASAIDLTEKLQARVRGF